MVDMLLSKLDKLSTLTLLVSFPLTLLVSFPLSELNWLSSDMIDDVYIVLSYDLVCYILINYVLGKRILNGDTKQSRLESTTEITQNKHVKVLHYFVDDIK